MNQSYDLCFGPQTYKLTIRHFSHFVTLELSSEPEKDNLPEKVFFDQTINQVNAREYIIHICLFAG